MKIKKVKIYKRLCEETVFSEAERRVRGEDGLHEPLTENTPVALLFLPPRVHMRVCVL